MQEKKNNKKHFFDRFRQLEDKKGQSASGLCKEIGISRSHYYAIINGEKPISNKAWRKLEAAERSAGIKPNSILNLNEDLPQSVEGERVAALEEGGTPEASEMSKAYLEIYKNCDYRME